MRTKRRAARTATLQLLPSLQTPPEAQLTNHRAMASSWGDPTDDRPGPARTQRQVSGYRAMCPLRRAMQSANRSSSFTHDHVRAADILRSLADGAAIGFSAPRDHGLPVTAILYRPKTGPGALATRQARCWRRFVQIMALFTKPQRALLTELLLLNLSVNKIVQMRQAAGLTVHPAMLMGTVLALLDQLVTHLEGELEKADSAA